MGLTDDDLRELENYLLNYPGIGDIIPGTGGAIKVRWALKGNEKGKSGGARIIYVDLIRKEHLHLIWCYPKGEHENLTEEQKKKIRQLTRALKGE